ncbi:cobyrinate a,c-diamide synthase [Sciscionella marina]|uniref:cobyrinate a,c-diamide synthase n=1 Tax=Sciscionella marina TaxID=508770 RepID=UPI0003619ECF
MVSTGRVVIAAPASGTGKTLVATGLMAALRARGHVVAPGKVGPDYIDPGYHTLAAGRQGRNLDPVLVGEHTVAPLFGHGARGADLAVIEGVMGLYDGRLGAEGFGSTAHVAELLDAPVLLVVDARGQSRSLAALLHGFRTYSSGVRIAGVILNNVGSPRHTEVLTEAANEVGLEVLGSLPRAAEVGVPSRHLGLLTAAEHGAEAEAAVRGMGELVAEHLDLDAVVRVARSAPPLTGPDWAPGLEPEPGSPVVAVASGRAFTFGYAEHTELLEAAGARVVTLDPLRDTALPPETAGLVLPGGFPELHAKDLAERAGLRAEIAGFARAGGPVHAECAGLLYLAQHLDGVPMCGVVPADARFTERLALGYRDAVATSDSVLFRAGERVAGHEFHRTTIEPGHGETAAWGLPGNRLEGFVTGQVHASYLHTHPVGSPEAITRFVAACARHMVDLPRSTQPRGRR